MNTSQDKKLYKKNRVDINILLNRVYEILNKKIKNKSNARKQNEAWNKNKMPARCAGGKVVFIRGDGAERVIVVELSWIQSFEGTPPKWAAPDRGRVRSWGAPVSLPVWPKRCSLERVHGEGKFSIDAPFGSKVPIRVAFPKNQMTMFVLYGFWSDSPPFRGLVYTPFGA